MLTLYHHALCPFSRKIRVALREKELAAELVDVEPWKREDTFIALNHACEVPVLVDDDLTIPDSQAIADYLEEAWPETTLLGKSLEQRSETRRLVAWFDVKFRREATDLLFGEKLLKRLRRVGTPSSEAMRAGAANLRGHMGYISHLYEDRRWLAGDVLTMADIAAAAHLSVLDYLGDVPWQDFPSAHDWYSRIKSRPSFRALLADRIVGVKPPDHYDDLDF
ncbi:MAG: glutathione S-transferase family protein [Geminicoccaceae bacterium]|nr:glutathione S-transferase family protein [Geminicoccaceae bacterium]